MLNLKGLLTTNAALGDLNNLVHYCKSNNCISKIKQFLYTYFVDDKLDSLKSSFLIKTH